MSAPQQKPQQSDGDKPLENTEVHVTVEPKDKRSQSDKDYSQRVKDTVKQKAKEAVEKNRDKGARKQVESVDDVIDEAKESVDPKRVEQVKVKVKGENADGDSVTHERSVKPTGKNR